MLVARARVVAICGARETRRGDIGVRFLSDTRSPVDPPARDVP
jgi:hypothetical protein